jgi:hypothetical protein
MKNRYTLMLKQYIRMPYSCSIAILEAIMTVTDYKVHVEASMTLILSHPMRPSCPLEVLTGMMEESGKISISIHGLQATR